jgi:hypothetical protein
MSRHSSVFDGKRHSHVFASGSMVLVGASAVLLGNCATATQHTVMATVRVEADLYSGRENPAWELEESDATRFLLLRAALPPEDAPLTSVPGGLGYRGLRVVVSSGDEVQRFVIGGGVVTEFAGETDQRHFRDLDRALEKWLLRTGKAQLGAELLEHLLASERSRP